MAKRLTVLLFLLICFCMTVFPIIVVGQEETNSGESVADESETPVTEQSPPMSVIEKAMEDQSPLPIPSDVRVMDNPDDDGSAIIIKWLVAQTPSVALLNAPDPMDSGTFGPVTIVKKVGDQEFCKEGKKKKSDEDRLETFTAKVTDGSNLSIRIYRAKAKTGKPVTPFYMVKSIPLGGELEKEEYRYTSDSEKIYFPDSKLGYSTPGKRLMSFRFWQSYVDDTVSPGDSYLYRIELVNGDSSRYLYRTVPNITGSNRLEYNRKMNFGPVHPILNALPSDKEAFEEQKRKNKAPVASPEKVNAIDNPSDSGDAIRINWIPSSDDSAVFKEIDAENSDNPVTGYSIFRAEITDGKPGTYSIIGATGPGLTKAEYEDQLFKDVKLKNFIDPEAPNKLWDPEKCQWYTAGYSYIVATRVSKDGMDLFSFSTPSAGVTSTTQWFDSKKIAFLVVTLLISFAIVWFIQHIRSGKKLFIRKIAGLDAIDEAIGRATEMGRPIIFIPGIQDMNDVQTVSAVIILGRIAKTIAEYDTKLMVPTSRSLVMTTARETVKEAYLTAGRPDAYNDDMITYLTDEQFGYVAGVNGIMVREKPATCFYLGAFFAESLILAETGNSIGAIQIAGTAMPSQLPFFIAACDYTLIGEELFAASAYLSNDPMQLGSLKGQDTGKVIAMFSIFTGVLLATMAEISGSVPILKVFEFFKNLFQVA